MACSRRRPRSTCGRGRRCSPPSSPAWERPGRGHLALHRRRLLRPRRRQAALRRRPRPPRGTRHPTCPRATRATLRTHAPCADSATGRTTRSTRCSPATASTPTPVRSQLLDLLREQGMPLAVVSSSANAPAVLEAAGLADRFVTVVDGRVATALRLAGQAGAGHLRPRREGVRHDARALGRSSRTPSPGCARAPRVASGSSSASTAGRAPTSSPRPVPTSSSTDLGDLA